MRIFKLFSAFILAFILAMMTVTVFADGPEIADTKSIDSYVTELRTGGFETMSPFDRPAGCTTLSVRSDFYNDGWDSVEWTSIHCSAHFAEFVPNEFTSNIPTDYGIPNNCTVNDSQVRVDDGIQRTVLLNCLGWPESKDVNREIVPVVQPLEVDEIIWLYENVFTDPWFYE